MPSEDTTFQSLSPINSVGDYIAMELENILQEGVLVEDQGAKNGWSNRKKLSPRRKNGSSSGAKSGASRQRKRQAAHELPKGKCTKKGRRTIYVCEPSEASQQPEPKGKDKSVKELIKEKSLAEVLKILRDRLNRRIKIDKAADMETYMDLLIGLMDMNLSCLFQPTVQFLKKMRSQWPVRADLEDIKKNIKEMEDEERGKGKQPTHDDEMTMEGTTDEKIQRLEEIERKIKCSDEERRKDDSNSFEIATTLVTEGFSMETLKEKLATTFPFLLPALDQFHGVPQIHKEFTVKDMEDLEKELFDKDNCNVGFSDFPGLKDAIDADEGNIPDHLISIAKKIEEDRGQPTMDVYRDILFLVSAAVKEMEDAKVDELDWPLLRKWGAAFNLAARMQFEVNFVENLLKKNMNAYFSRRLISSLKVAVAA